MIRFLIKIEIGKQVIGLSSENEEFTGQKIPQKGGGCS
jgi:hypothetical protein